jgi:hypothetical protein
MDSPCAALAVALVFGTGTALTVNPTAELVPALPDV